MKSKHLNLSHGSATQFKLSPLSVTIRASIVGIGLAHGAAQSAEIVVNSNLDDGSGCTLREAIVSANNAVLLDSGCTKGSASGTDTITFSNSLASNTITLTGENLDVVGGKDIEINGRAIDGGITVNAGSLSRVFKTTSATLTIDNLTITGGLVTGQTANGGGISAIASNVTLNNSKLSGNSASGNVGSYGGGISATASSSVALNNSTVSGNSASGDEGGYGGGVYANASIITLNNSTVSGNSAGYDGGGIAVEDSSSVSLINSTISGNMAAGYGGGIFAYNSNAALSNSTISNNSAVYKGDGIYGSVGVGSGTSIALSNSIIADAAYGDDVSLSSSTLISDSASIIEEASYGGSRYGDPGLLPLADNGGLTRTHALKPDSIARDTGVLTGAEGDFENCTPRDQRGQLRDDGDGKCDVGAIEFNSSDDGSDDNSFFVIPLPNGKAAVILL